MDPTQWPMPLRVQGVLCLTDTTADQGGFQCVPGSHKQVQEIISKQAPDANLRSPDINGLTVKPIEGKAGDMVIWNVGTLHGNGRNKTDQPRLAQYITMYRADEDNEEARQKRIEQWQKCVPPDNKRAFPGDPRKLEETAAQPAELTDLGKKLLGLERWSG
jgi:ectoine hydroxylase-related dioxygenase (phytanoyl-CoA dioxygenase family)